MPSNELAYVQRMTKETRILYNAECPVCSFEIDRYAAYSDKRNLPLRFDDLNSAALGDWDISADQAARRLHVLHEGKLTSGLDAFIVLWQQMPRTKGLAWLASLPVIRPVASAVYDHILAPIIYRWHLRRQAKAQV